MHGTRRWRFADKGKLRSAAGADSMTDPIARLAQAPVRQPARRQRRRTLRNPVRQRRLLRRAHRVLRSRAARRASGTSRVRTNGWCCWSVALCSPSPTGTCWHCVQATGEPAGALSPSRRIRVAGCSLAGGALPRRQCASARNARGAEFINAYGDRRPGSRRIDCASIYLRPGIGERFVLEARCCAWGLRVVFDADASRRRGQLLWPAAAAYIVS